MEMSLEERIARLEAFIGNIDQIRLYANSLQEVLDTYIAPLYIENGSGATVRVDAYLGDLDNIPRNVIFKVRMSHNINMAGSTEAQISFERGNLGRSFRLTKLVNGSLVNLETDNLLNGQVYDVYINSQNIAVITSNDTGVRALSELAALESRLTSRINTIDNREADHYDEVTDLIEDTETECKGHTTNLVNPLNTAVNNLQTFLSGITTSNNRDYTFSGNVSSSGVNTVALRVTGTVDVASAAGFVLPRGCTIQDPSANLHLTNKSWVESLINNKITAYHSSFHYSGTAAASSAMNGKENNSYYYKHG